VGTLGWKTIVAKKNLNSTGKTGGNFIIGQKGKGGVGGLERVKS